MKYLTREEERRDAILKNRNQKFQFQHQEVDEIPEYKYGIHENEVEINPFGMPLKLSLQANDDAGKFVRAHAEPIEKAASEFSVSADLVKAVIYTEMARGWYDKFNILGADSILPGNVSEIWEPLIPGSSVHNKADNIRLTAKLLSEIEKRLDVPFPEDVYSLYNGMAHDRTYQNAKLKSTPYFLKKVLEERAWEQDIWSLRISGEKSAARSERRLLSDDLTKLDPDKRPYLPNHLRLLPPNYPPTADAATKLSAGHQQNNEHPKPKKAPPRQWNPTMFRLLSGDLTALDPKNGPFSPNLLRMLMGGKVHRVKGATVLEDIARPRSGRIGR